MYKEALEILDSIDCGSQPEYLHQFYYHIRRTVYGLMAAYSVREADRQRYDSLTMQYRDSVIACNTPGTLGYSINMADKLNNTGRPPRGDCRDGRDYGHMLAHHPRYGHVCLHPI